MTIGELGFDFEYIHDQDRHKYLSFCLDHVGSYGRPQVDEVWHYTTAEGLIAILQTGKIFSTQVTCLNDTLEQRYFGDLVYNALKPLIAKNSDGDLGIFLKITADALINRDFSTAWHFVSCFSENGDDLGQWRGYGGGECGYAIGFYCNGLLDALKARPNTAFLPMQYLSRSHDVLVNEILKVGLQYFKNGISEHKVTNIERWAQEFLIAFSWQLDIFASVTKHPKFSGEMERRIVTSLQLGEHKDLEFRQKRTLLARHLPIDLTVETDAGRLLPLSRICIGPSPAQRVSQISVGDLLLKFGYKKIPVELSAVPYRIP